MGLNLFRIAGDMLHCLAVCLIVHRVVAKKNAQGETDILDGPSALLQMTPAACFISGSRSSSLVS